MSAPGGGAGWWRPMLLLGAWAALAASTVLLGGDLAAAPAATARDIRIVGGAGILAFAATIVALPRAGQAGPRRWLTAALALYAAAAVLGMISGAVRPAAGLPLVPLALGRYGLAVAGAGTRR